MHMYMSSQGREVIAARGKNEEWGAWWAVICKQILKI